jgi:hypothetical protein
MAEQLRRGQADTAVAAPHDGDFSFKLFRCLISFVRSGLIFLIDWP